MRIEGPVPVAAPAGGVRSPVEAAEKRELIRAVKAINAGGSLGAENELVFFLDRQTGRPVIRIVNRVTRDVLRQIPSERVLRLAEDLNLAADGR
jgi:flagellar protein FlaG